MTAEPRPRTLLPALLAAGLLGLAFFPADQGWLAWVALVPLLTLVRGRGGWRLYGSAWIGGVAFYAPVLLWMPVADPRMYATWAALTAYCAGYWPLAVALVRALDRRGWPLALSAPAVWVALEYARAHLLTGFAWYFLAHTQHRALPLIQVSDLGGAYAVSLLVAAVNAALAEWALASPAVRRWLRLPADAARATPRGRAAGSLAAAGLVLAALGYGAWQLVRSAPEPGPRVALLQGSVDQRIRNSRENGPAESARQYLELINLVRDHGLAPDLAVWPETSFPADWPEFDPAAVDDEKRPHLERWRAATLEDIRRAGGRLGSAQVLGLDVLAYPPDGRNRRHNASLFADRSGAAGPWYAKIHCVPFGEYVPLRDVLPFMNTFAPYDFDYSVTPGTEFTRFRLTARDGREYTFGVVICYEDTDPPLARAYVAPGTEKVDFLVNQSNDGWFDGSAEHEQHLAVSRFRAVECRRALVRAVNMGVSAVVDADGRVAALPRVVGDGGELGPPAAAWSAAKRVRGVVDAVVPIDGRASAYARFGDWLPAACWAVVLSGVFARLVPAAVFKTAGGRE